MKPFKQFIAGWLILSLSVLFFPSTGHCSDPRLLAKAGTKKITLHKPKIMSSPAQAIPVEAGKGIGTGTWILVGLGIAAVAALAAGGGGGGDSDTTTNTEPASGSGDIEIGW